MIGRAVGEETLRVGAILEPITFSIIKITLSTRSHGQLVYKTVCGSDRSLSGLRRIQESLTKSVWKSFTDATMLVSFLPWTCKTVLCN